MDIRQFLAKPTQQWSTESYTDSQQQAFALLQSGKSCFITGPAGTGKTYLIQEFRKWAQQNYKTVAVCATTGCAAYLINGVTIHSWSHIGLGDGPVEMLIRKIRSYHKAVQRWQNTDVLVIDEVSMMAPELLERLDRCAREIRGNEQPFGGLQVVAVGDFFQLPPVVTGNTSSSDGGGRRCFCFESPVWQQLFPPGQVAVLTDIVRQDDPVFQSVLNKIRTGQLDQQVKDTLESRMVDSKAIRVKGIRPTRIFPHRYTADSINAQKLDRLTGTKHPYVAEVSMGTNTVPLDDDVRPFIRNLPCHEKIKLAERCQVMLVVNLDTLRGLVNGSRGVVTGFDGKWPKVKFVSGVEVTVEPHRWTIDSEGRKSITVKQVPLVLAWAITIHKSQGTSLDLAEIDVGSSLFEYGQAYVALSRVRRLRGLRILSLSMNEIRAHPTVLRFYRSLRKDGN